MLGLRRIKQPTVIAEIIAGIVLGPTAMGMFFPISEKKNLKCMEGRIPGFTNHIFPTNSIAFLNLTANLG